MHSSLLPGNLLRVSCSSSPSTTRSGTTTCKNSMCAQVVIIISGFETILRIYYYATHPICTGQIPVHAIFTSSVCTTEFKFRPDDDSRHRASSQHFSGHCGIYFLFFFLHAFPTIIAVSTAAGTEPHKASSSGRCERLLRGVEAARSRGMLRGYMAAYAVLPTEVLREAPSEGRNGRQLLNDALDLVLQGARGRTSASSARC
mmetsp:Transcript_30211/g.51084  ORF Transcript_30211/g.51084 Transcript_30211/m.51084 type:complete len:202 (-) Transcript_30211:2489-3094(-)